jgi:hypothetical protein
MTRSGAGITWDYFFPDVSRPRLISYVEDNDLWIFKHPETKPFISLFHNVKHDFSTFLLYLNDLNDDQGNNLINITIQAGESILKFKNEQVDNLCKSAYFKLHKFDNEYIIGVYVNTPLFISEVGNRLFDIYPIADFSSPFNFSGHVTKFSLRSTNDRCDVSKIAKSLGGGGHRNASGVTLQGLNPYISSNVIVDNGLIKGLSELTILPLEQTGNKYCSISVDAIDSIWYSDDEFWDFWLRIMGKLNVVGILLQDKTHIVALKKSRNGKIIRVIFVDNLNIDLALKNML